MAEPKQPTDMSIDELGAAIREALQCAIVMLLRGAALLGQAQERMPPEDFTAWARDRFGRETDSPSRDLQHQSADRQSAAGNSLRKEPWQSESAMRP